MQSEQDAINLSKIGTNYMPIHIWKKNPNYSSQEEKILQQSIRILQIELCLFDGEKNANSVRIGLLLYYWSKLDFVDDYCGTEFMC